MYTVSNDTIISIIGNDSNAKQCQNYQAVLCSRNFSKMGGFISKPFINPDSLPGGHLCVQAVNSTMVVNCDEGAVAQEALA
jgi:hypothetical protein